MVLPLRCRKPIMSKRNRVVLVAAIACLGLIALTVTVMRGPLMTARVGATVTKSQAQCHVLGIALQVFRNDHGRWPSEDEGLDALLNDPNGPYVESSSALIDPWGQRIRYRVSSDGTASVSSLGADKSIGGIGIDSDIVVTVSVPTTQPNRSATTRSAY